MNLKIREFKLTLQNYIESSDVLPEVKNMVLKELYENAIAEANRAIAEELEKRDREEAEGKEADSE